MSPMAKVSRETVRKEIAGLVAVLIVMCLFATALISSGHKPIPRNLPFGVVGSSSLVTAVSKELSLKTIQYPSESAVQEAFDQGKLYGALVPGNGTNTLIVNGSASSFAGVPLTTNFEKAAAQQKTTVTVQPSNNPPSGDPFAVIPALILVPLLIGGYVASTALMTATGSPTGPRRVALLVIFAFVGALLMDLISGAFAWGWPIHQFWPLWPIMALTIAAVALVASVLQKLLGAAGTLLTIILLIQFGNPSSGGSSGVPFLPTFWRDIGPYLPPRNGLTAIHNTMYFNGRGITQALVILGIYVVVFGALSGFLGRYRTPQQPLTPEASLQAASVSVAGTGVAKSRYRCDCADLFEPSDPPTTRASAQRGMTTVPAAHLNLAPRPDRGFRTSARRRRAHAGANVIHARRRARGVVAPRAALDIETPAARRGRP
jgi:hypothetical protein